MINQGRKARHDKEPYPCERSEPTGSAQPHILWPTYISCWGTSATAAMDEPTPLPPPLPSSILAVATPIVAEPDRIVAVPKAEPEHRIMAVPKASPQSFGPNLTPPASDDEADDDTATPKAAVPPPPQEGTAPQTVARIDLKYVIK